jgi:hypothetical protein
MGAGIRQQLACRVEFCRPGESSPERRLPDPALLFVDLRGHGFLYSSRDRPGYAHAHHIRRPGSALTLTTTTLPNATVNTAYSATLTATGGVTPYTFTLANGTSLPTGLTLSSAGVISGTPTKAGSTPFSVQVVDSSTPTPLSQTGNLSITVNARQPGPSACGNMSTGNGASLNGYVPFPASNAWNTNIASAPVDPNSAAIITALTGSNLHPDFSNVVDGNYGIPYVVVDSSVTPPCR